MRFSRPPRPRHLAALLVGTLLVFALGYSVGNGSLQVPGLRPVSSSIPGGLDPSPLWRVWNEIERRYDGPTDQTKQLQGTLRGLVQSLGDPYSEFMNPAETRAFKDQLAGRVEGIGAEVGLRSGQIVIISPISGSPAERAGLRPGDAIVSVDGKSTQGISLGEAVGKIRGKKGTSVKLQIRRGSETLEMTITRDLIHAPSVTSRDEGGYAYIRISQFEQGTAESLRTQLRERLAANPKGVILDLRGDPGGYLQAAVSVVSQFVPAGDVVVRERSRHSPETVMRAERGGLLSDGRLPIAVLIDGGSASASEIVAGALRDHHRAALIGEKSFGKGSVQDFESLADGSSLRLTIAHWYTPSGHGINHAGLTPDVTLKADESGQNLIERAKTYLSEKH